LVNLVYLVPFWYIVPRKIWQPCWTYMFMSNHLSYMRKLHLRIFLQELFQPSLNSTPMY
jgi:hypothetical protein